MANAYYTYYAIGRIRYMFLLRVSGYYESPSSIEAIFRPYNRQCKSGFTGILTELIVVDKLILIRSRQMTRNQKKSQLEECLQGLAVDDESEESEAECPKCGLVYGEDNSVWIQCDSCGLWYDLKCTNVNHDNIPEAFSCEICC